MNAVPPGKDLFVRCLHMRVSANYSRNFSIEKSAERDFLARGLAMCIHNDVGGFFAHLRRPLLPRREMGSPESAA